MPDQDALLERLRGICLALPEATEQDHHGRPSFRVGGRIFATLWDEHHLNVMVDQPGILTATQSRPQVCSEVWWGKRLAAARVDLRRDRHEDRWSVWCKAPTGSQHALVQSDPVRYFVPPYVGIHGWIGISLEVDQDWDFTADLIEQSYRMTAPRKLVARMQNGER